MIGPDFSHYKITAKLGEGAMGVVYRAVDTHLNRPVAIKVLRPEAMTNPARRARLAREARAASALNHPNIITIYDIDRADGMDFIAMEFVPGQTLGELIGRRGLPFDEILKYGVQIADALASAHGAGIVHRDLKPANIMVSGPASGRPGQVKVVDFGLAKLTEPISETPAGADEEATESAHTSITPATDDGAIVGTVAYMSPEQAEGKKVDARSDIFSFGSVLYEMVTGEQAFQGETRISTLGAVLHKHPKPVGETVKDARPDLEKIVALCLRKPLDRRLQHMDDVKALLQDLKEDFESGRLAAGGAVAAGGRSGLGREALATAILAGAVLLVGIVALTWWMARSRAPSPPLILTRLTSDSGLTFAPAISPDGKLLVYASDRSGEGNLDLWVQQVGRGSPIRLTRDPADETEPAFSPDGALIAFRSERNRGGIYLIPSLGGSEPRLIAAQGRRPRFSPDGARVAYYGGVDTGKIYLIASGGGAPRQLQEGFVSALHPVWSPDGKQLLFLGWNNPNAPAAERYEWWVTPVEGGSPVNTGVCVGLERQGFAGPYLPAAWIADGNQVVFSARLGDSVNLWQIPISPRTGRRAGEPQRLTSGSSLEAQPSVAAAAGGSRLLVFSSLNENIDIWALALDANQGKVRGELQRLTQDASAETRASLSADGKKLVFESNRSGNSDLWLKDLETGNLAALTITPADESWPTITADGARVAYRAYENQKSALYLIPAVSAGQAGVPEKVCEDCDAPWDWLGDGTRILYRRGQPLQIALLDLSSGAKTELLQQPQHDVVHPQFSPDGRWIAFHGGISPDRTRVWVAPFGEGTRVADSRARSEWIAVTTGGAFDMAPRWSPDGNLLYFLSDRDGFACIWAQRVDPSTKRPTGPPLNVYHFHRARIALANVGYASLRLGVGRDKIVFSLGERTGNIWLGRSSGQ